MCGWVKPRNPGPRDPASSTHSTTLGKAGERPEGNLGAPGPSPRTSRTSPAKGDARPPPAAAHCAPLPPRGRACRARGAQAPPGAQAALVAAARPLPLRAPFPGVSAPYGREPGTLGLGNLRTRRLADGRPPQPRRLRAQCGLPFPAARASPGPGNKAGSARRRAPGRAADTHRELCKPPAGRAWGCRVRRGWAQGTGLGSAAATAGRKCGSETGREGRGAETAARAPPGPPPEMCVTSELGRRNTDGSRSPGGWRGAGSWARPVRGLNK